MIDKMGVLNYRYDSDVEQEGDKWLAKSHLFGMVAYGDTDSTAKDALESLIDFFLVSFFDERGTEAVRKFLDTHDICHSLTPIAGSSEPHGAVVATEVGALALAAH